MSDVPTKMASFLKHSQINASSYLYGSNLHVCVFYAGIVFNCYPFAPTKSDFTQNYAARADLHNKNRM